MSEQIKSIVNAQEQLNAYEVGVKVYDQIFSLQRNLSNTSNIFLAITGALWVTIATNKLQLPNYASNAILSLHVIASISLLLIYAGILNATSLRFKFLPKFGEHYYPDIEKIGKECFKAIYNDKKSFKARFARWGRQRFFWYLVPLCGLLGSMFFMLKNFGVLSCSNT